MRISLWWCVISLALGLTACAHKPPAGGAETAASAPVQVQTEEVTYQSGETPLKGFLAYPANTTDKRPGVLVVHEWWGLNDYVRSRAKKLAELGYVALALDMYGNGKNATHPEDAQKFMMEIMSNKEEGMKRFEAAKALLQANPHTDPSKLAAIGYCMGGAIALHMARHGEDLALIGSFHGNLATDQPMPPNAFKGHIFVATGGADPFVPPEQVAAFRKEMDAAGANYEIIEYPGVKHGFTNPDATAVGQQYNIPLAYDAAADADSWAKFTALLQHAFQ